MSSLTSLFRNAYGGISKPIWWLALTLFINRSGTMVVFFLSVYLNIKLQFPLGQIGVILAMYGAGSFLGVFVGGRLIDKIGYYPVMFWSLLIGGILFILVGQMQSYPMLCLGMFVLSAVGEAFRPANMAAISHYSKPENYTRSISLNRLAINLGFSIGPAIGGFLAAIDYKLIFWVDGLTCIAAAIVVVIFLENKTHTEAIKSSAEAELPGSSPYKDKIYLLFLPLSCLYAIVFLQFFITMPLYYKVVHHLNETQIGSVLALNGALVAAIEMILIYKIEKRWTPNNFIALGAFLLVLTYVSLLIANGIWFFYLITVIISFSEMFALPFMNTFMNSRSAKNKGQYASLYVMSWSVAQVATPLIATQVIAFAGYPALWILFAVISLLVLVGIKMLERITN